MTGPRTRRKDRQSGAALIVGLVLMMVLTILAISTMRTSTLELAMAGNTQYREKARQLAEAGLADALDRIERGDYVPAEADNPDPTEEPPWSAVPVAVGELDPASGDTYRVEIRYLSSGAPPPGGSQGREDMQAHYFELQSTGITAARNARVVLRRGFWKYAN